MGLILAIDKKKSDTTWSPPWKQKCVWELGHQYLPSHLHICTIKEEYISEAHLRIILDNLILKQTCNIWYIFISHFCMWSIQSWIDTVIHMARMFDSAILMIVAPPPIKANPNVTASFKSMVLFELSFIWKCRSNNSPPTFLQLGQTKSSPSRRQLLECAKTVMTQLLYLECSQNGNNLQQQTQAGHYGICKYHAGSWRI